MDCFPNQKERYLYMHRHTQDHSLSVLLHLKSSIWRKTASFFSKPLHLRMFLRHSGHIPHSHLQTLLLRFPANPDTSRPVLSLDHPVLRVSQSAPEFLFLQDRLLPDFSLHQFRNPPVFPIPEFPIQGPLFLKYLQQPLCPPRLTQLPL